MTKKGFTSLTIKDEVYKQIAECAEQEHRSVANTVEFYMIKQLKEKQKHEIRG